MTFDAESVDLLALTLRLQRRQKAVTNLDGYMEGKTRLRDAVASDLGCSQLEAEQVTDTLVAQGFARFFDRDHERVRPGSAPGYWQLNPHR
jgi:hypothetical protein